MGGDVWVNFMNELRESVETETLTFVGSSHFIHIDASLLDLVLKSEQKAFHIVIDLNLRCLLASISVFD